MPKNRIPAARSFLFGTAMLPLVVYSEAPSLYPPLSPNQPAPQENSAIRGSLELLTPIDAQLRYLRDGDIQSAYTETTSAEFKKTTPFELFTQYIEKYPALTTHESLTVKSQMEQGDKASVNIVLDPGKSNLSIQYILTREGGTWKIWNMEIMSQYAPAVSALIQDPTSLKKPVEEFLVLLREGNVPKAYHGYTSKEFQTETPIEGFRKFFDNYQSLLRYKELNLDHAVIYEGTGKVEATLVGENLTTTLEFTLGIVDNEWKIWGISVLKQEPKKRTNVETPPININPPGTTTEPHLETPSSDFFKHPATSTSEGTLQFAKIEIGDHVDAKGAIVDPQSSLSSSHNDIYVELYVLNGSQGDRIEARLKHFDTQSELPKISTTLQQNGNSVISFSFAPPAAGWPRGTYELEVESSTGRKKVFSFLVH